MKKEERELLFLQKIKEGKSEKQAWAEVERDIFFIENFIKTKKQMEKEIKELKKEKENLNQKFKKEFTKMVKEQSKENKEDIKVTTNKYANTHHLTRIINLLKNEKRKMNQTEIAEFCMLNNQQCKSALLFLYNNNLVEKDGKKYEYKLG